MAPPRNPPDPYEQEYAIRRLVEIVENNTEQMATLTNRVQRLEENALVEKTKRGVFWAAATAIAGVVGIIVKLLPPIHLP